MDFGARLAVLIEFWIDPTSIAIVAAIVLPALVVFALVTRRRARPRAKPDFARRAGYGAEASRPELAAFAAVFAAAAATRARTTPRRGEPVRLGPANEMRKLTAVIDRAVDSAARLGQLQASALLQVDAAEHALGALVRDLRSVMALPMAAEPLPRPRMAAGLASIAQAA